MKKLFELSIALSLFTSCAVSAAPIISDAMDLPGNLWYVEISGTNDCSGYFGQGFENCEAFGSPIVAKWDSEENKWEINSSFASITASDFSISFDPNVDYSGIWAYTPDSLEDPEIRYWVAKGGNGFNLFWYGPDDNPLNAIAVARDGTENSWFTPGQKGLSHLSWYDTGTPPGEVPEPGAIALLGIGALGLAFMTRRRRR
jgi:hypothetical protein